MVYTKVMNLLLFCLKLYHILLDSNFVWPCQMAAILVFNHHAMSTLLSGHTTKRTYRENQWPTPKSWFSFDFAKKYINFLFWPCRNGGHFGFFSQCKVLSKIRPHHYVRCISIPYGTHENHDFASILWTMISIVFHFAKMAAIFYFTYNAMSKILSDYITTSGITENRMA